MSSSPLSAATPMPAQDLPFRAEDEGRQVNLPSHVYPPMDAIYFDAVGYVATPAVGVANRTIVVSVSIPGGTTGVVRWLANVFLGGGFTDGSGAVVWRIFKDDMPVQNYENVQASLGAVVNPTETYIPVRQNQVVKWTVETTVNLVGTTIGCRLKGWYWT